MNDYEKNKSENNFIIDKDDLCYEENMEETSLAPFSTAPLGILVSSFNFTEDAVSPKENLEDNRKTKTATVVATPSVEGEAYTIGRFYKLRYSTAKMLNEIKAAHPDVNVYMNTIVDEAIRYYYSFLFKNES